MTKEVAKISRRQALGRLGLALGAAYCAPLVVSASQARAASGSSPASSASRASTPSGPSPASEPSRASAPSSTSAPSSPVRDNGTKSDAGNQLRTGCSQPSGASRATISRRDMQRAQAAITRGDAKTLREVVEIVQRNHPGRLIKVGFQGSGADQAYWLQMVSGGGSVQTITVDAGSGAIISVRGC